MLFPEEVLDFSIFSSEKNFQVFKKTRSPLEVDFDQNLPKRGPSFFFCTKLPSPRGVLKSARGGGRLFFVS